MRKVSLLLLAALAALLLAGCNTTVSPVSSPTPSPTPKPQATVTHDDGLTLVTTVDAQTLLDRMGNPEASFWSPVFVSADRLLLPIMLYEGGAEWYLYELETDTLTLLARLPECCPQISAAWAEGEQIRVVSDVGAFALNPAGQPSELPGGEIDWTLRGNPVTGEVYRQQDGQLVAAAPDGSESVRYAWPGKGSPAAVAVSPDGKKLFFGIIRYESISNVVVLDLSTCAAEVTPMHAAYPWYCWLGEQPCLVTVDEAQEGLLLRYGDSLATTFLWQPAHPDGWQNAQIASCAGGRLLLTFSYPVGEEGQREALSLLSWDGTGITEQLLETDGRITGVALSQDAGTLAIWLRDAADVPPRLLLYTIDS